jgi:hypothetical protein
MRKEFKKHLLLFIRVDDQGEAIELGVEFFDGLLNKDSANRVLGVLQRGESYAVDLKGLRGVTARCQHDTWVTCTVVPLED